MKMSVQIERVTPSDIGKMQELLGVFALAFEMKAFNLPSAAYLESLLRDPHVLVWVARADGRVVGGITGYVLPQCYSERPQAYVYDLAVLDNYQRSGIGTQLLAAFRTFCQASDYETLFVQADVDDQHAIKFYRSTRPDTELPVIHFSYNL